MKRKLENKINELLNKFIGYYIEAHDNNRWVASDGFYEVEFSLNICYQILIVSSPLQK